MDNLEQFKECISQFTPEPGTKIQGTYHQFLNYWVFCIFCSFFWNAHLAHILYLWW